MIEGLWGFRYEDYEADPMRWRDAGMDLPRWAEELSDRGFHGVSPCDFYEDIFRDELEEHRERLDYRSGEYGAILLELQEERIDSDTKRQVRRSNRSRRVRQEPVIRTRRHQDENGEWHDYQVHPRRFTVTRDLEILRDKVNTSTNFCLMAPVAYAGRARSDANARFMYALAIEIDDIQERNGIDNLVYFWRRENRPLPQPTYIVCSGNGIHLYYVFEKPIPLFGNIMEQLNKAKHYLTERFWVKPITSAFEKVQHEAVCQGFRVVGTRGKDGRSIAMAFETGKPVTIEYINGFLPKDCAINRVYKTDLPLEKARELYPKWYQKRIVEKKEKGVFHKNRAVYDAWKRRMYESAVVSKRYYCLENLCSLAVQCEISPEEVEKDCHDLMEYLETLTIKEDNHFTEYDVICALYTYENRGYKAYARRLEFISNRTGIQLERAKRNGRKQGIHLSLARDRLHSLQRLEIDLNGPVGRPSKAQEVQEYLRMHPEATPTQIAKALGVSRPTVYKYIGSAAENNAKLEAKMMARFEKMEKEIEEAMAKKDYAAVQRLAHELEQLKRLVGYTDKITDKDY